MSSRYWKRMIRYAAATSRPASGARGHHGDTFVPYRNPSTAARATAARPSALTKSGTDRGIAGGVVCPP
jgi:hypothetical protein